MKFRFIPAALITASALAAAPALAGQSELQRGDFTVPLACSVSPVTAALTANGQAATGAGSGNFSQNSNTKYSLSALTLSGPMGTNNAAYGGSITVNSASAGQLVTNNSTSAAATGTQVSNLQNSTYETGFAFSTSEATFRAGNYAVAATLTCAQVES